MIFTIYHNLLVIDFQIGGYYVSNEGAEQTFSQYVMPYKNPNPGARRSFGIKVVSIGRYRMLKDVETGRILKTKSEISAIQEFIDWLKEAKGSKDGVLLVCHEPTRKVLVPLLLEALYRYNLVNNFILKKKKKSLECNLLRYSWQ
jgi:maternal-effect protein exuperantia